MCVRASTSRTALWIVTARSGRGDGSVNFFGGTGVAANLSIDPATVTRLGSGLAPIGVGTDLNGNVISPIR